MDFTSLLKTMKDRRASDLFISAGAPPSLKIDGKIVPVSKTPLTAEQAKTIIDHTMTPMQRQNFEHTSESNFALNLSESGRFRVNVFRHQTQMGMVLRRIETSIPDFDQLQLPPIMREFAMYRHGLVLVVGSTGVGKSTTLASMIQHRNTNTHGHIVSIEDPIEYIHKPDKCIITQREIGIDTASYESALKNTLRQSPDMIVIGEIRSRETMQHALEFAETGHLCLATLHATNSFQAIDRIVSFFPEDGRAQILMELSLNLKAIVAQRLVKLKDNAGRRVAIESMLNTPLVSSHIRNGDTHSLKEVIKKSAEQGMQLIDDDLFELFKKGLIDRDEALTHADSANELRLKIKLLEQKSVSQPSLSSISLIDKFQ